MPLIKSDLPTQLNLAILFTFSTFLVGSISNANYFFSVDLFLLFFNLNNSIYALISVFYSAYFFGVLNSNDYSVAYDFLVVNLDSV